MLKGRYFVVFTLSALLTVSLQGLAGGEELFRNHCSSCHGESGSGIPGLAPPLQNPELWAALGDQAPRYLAGVVANGMSGKLEVDGQVYQGLIMPPQPSLDAETITSISQYVLTQINPLSIAVSVDRVSALLPTRMSHSDLRKIRQGGN